MPRKFVTEQRLVIIRLIARLLTWQQKKESLLYIESLIRCRLSVASQETRPFALTVEPCEATARLH